MGCGNNGRPDLLAVDKKRQLIEVEIKVSLSDYRQDFKKRHREFAHIFGDLRRKMYYAVPPFLVDEVKKTAPEGWGILTIRHPFQEIFPKQPNWDYPAHVARAAKNVKERATVKQCLEMARHLTGTLVSLSKECAAHSKPCHEIYLAS